MDSFKLRAPICARWMTALLLVTSAVLLIANIGCDIGNFMTAATEVTDPASPADPTIGIGPNANTENNNSQNVDQQNRNPLANAIIIGSFNIQSFGRTKMSKPEVTTVLADIVRRFDILAIQELRDKDQRVIPEFLDLVNRGGHNFRASVGPRQGYFVQKDQRSYEEQMVYIYDADRIEVAGPGYVAQDQYQQYNRPPMHRPPYVAQFRCRNALPGQIPFSFVLMNVHVDPDDTEVEFKAMQQMLSTVYANHKEEDDFILLGDLNDDTKGFQNIRWMSNQFAAIPDHWKTNTRQTKSYDNIVFDAGRTSEFMNQCGVLNLMTEYKLSYEKAREVSDHMPVWAVFSARESMSTTVTKEPQVIR